MRQQPDGLLLHFAVSSNWWTATYGLSILCCIHLICCTQLWKLSVSFWPTYFISSCLLVFIYLLPLSLHVRLAYLLTNLIVYICDHVWYIFAFAQSRWHIRIYYVRIFPNISHLIGFLWNIRDVIPYNSELDFGYWRLSQDKICQIYILNSMVQKQSKRLRPHRLFLSMSWKLDVDFCRVRMLFPSPTPRNIEKHSISPCELFTLDFLKWVLCLYSCRPFSLLQKAKLQP